jgi:hypothetical protein
MKHIFLMAALAILVCSFEANAVPRTWCDSDQVCVEKRGPGWRCELGKNFCIPSTSKIE